MKLPILIMVYHSQKFLLYESLDSLYRIYLISRIVMASSNMEIFNKLVFLNIQIILNNIILI